MNEVDYSTGPARVVLADICKATRAVRGDFNDMHGYFVMGKLRNYFVEIATANVYDADDGTYISIIMAGSFHGDNRALPSVLVALKHDDKFQRTILTLKKSYGIQN